MFRAHKRAKEEDASTASHYFYTLNPLGGPRRSEDHLTIHQLPYPKHLRINPSGLVILLSTPNSGTLPPRNQSNVSCVSPPRHWEPQQIVATTTLRRQWAN